MHSLSRNAATARRKILICRLSHIGDCILALPMVNALRDCFPNTHIGWVVERPTQQLLEDHAAVDQLFVLERGWLKSPRRLRQLGRDLRQVGFDITLDPQSLTKSAVPAWLSGARQRVGLARPHARELAILLNNQRVHCPADHLVDRCLQLLAPLGIDRPAISYNMPRYHAESEEVARWLRDLPGAGSFAVINPGGSWHSKRWPPDRFGHVARQLGQARDLITVVTWAGKDERRWAEEIVEIAQGHARLAPPTSLRALAELLRRSRFFLGSDTGPLHIAAGVGTACVGLYGPTRPQDSGAYGPQHVAVQAYYQAGSCRVRRRADNLAMQAIEVDEVCEACDEVLRRNAQPATHESDAA